MTYSQDLRERVIKFVENGGSSREASKRYDVARRTVFYWLKRSEPKKMGPKSAHKLDMQALQKDVEVHRDALLLERAERLGVTPQAVWYALRRLDITKAI